MSKENLTLKLNLITALGLVQHFARGTFYVITVADHGITLQGKGEPESIRKAIALDFLRDDNPDLKYLEYNRGIVNIVFTAFEMDGTKKPPAE
jgi:hypothetical protein